MAINNVIAQLREKDNNGNFTDFPIGGEVRNIGAQRNSNDNNLEEQLIVGTDSQSHHVLTVDNLTGNVTDTETITFKVDGSTNDYYILTKTVTKKPDVKVDNNKLILNLSPEVVSHSEVLTFKSSSTVNPKSVSSKSVVYTYGNETGTNNPTVDVVSAITNQIV